MSEREELVPAPQRNHGVTFSVRLVAPDERPDELIETFRSLLGPIGAATGCLGCHLLEDVQHPEEVQLLVEWKRREDFERHVRTELFRRVLQGLELSAVPPELRIRTIAGVRGMDLLREILGCEDE